MKKPVVIGLAIAAIVAVIAGGSLVVSKSAGRWADAIR